MQDKDVLAFGAREGSRQLVIRPIQSRKDSYFNWAASLH